MTIFAQLSKLVSAFKGTRLTFQHDIFNHGTSTRAFLDALRRRVFFDIVTSCPSCSTNCLCGFLFLSLLEIGHHVFIKRLNQRFYRVPTGRGNNGGTRILIRRVQRQGQVDFRQFIGEFSNLRDQTYSGNSDAPMGQIPLRSIDQRSTGFHDIRVIVKGLSHTHEYNVPHQVQLWNALVGFVGIDIGTFAFIFLAPLLLPLTRQNAVGVDHLFQNLSAGQISTQPHGPRRAKGTAHGATALTRYTE
mmetsp:Transcript_17619/g.41436  ORF Transcript_17619/g.41436 Transcript_17619/m.41436 type:complete len:246 (+) Transcript_17619:505-1242(+)